MSDPVNVGMQQKQAAPQSENAETSTGGTFMAAPPFQLQASPAVPPAQQKTGNKTGANTSGTSGAVVQKKADHNLGLTGSVGLKMTNKAADVTKVRDKLVAYGFLDKDKTDQASLNEAIGKFQKTVLGMKNPDKQISAGGGTDRALTTYYTATPTDFAPLKTALGDISVSTVEASTSYTTAMAGQTINASSSPGSVSIPALIALEDRLLQIKSSYMGKGFSNADLKALKSKKNADLSAAEQKIVKSHISKAVAGLKKFQTNKKIEWWSNKKRNDSGKKYVLTDTTKKATYTAGQIAPGDATFIYLSNHKKYTMSWKQEDGSKKSRTRSNFVKSGVTTYEEGISDAGTIDPEKSSIDKFKKAGGIDESRAKALRHASHHEGNYDAINTYDRAVISYGFIQFAGGNRSIEYLFGRIKSEHPKVWQSLFAKYGIDVEYKTSKSGVVKKSSCRIVIHDAENSKTLRGLEAEQALKNNIKFSGVLMKAAENKVVQDMQIAVAVSNYVRPSENTKITKYKVDLLKVSDATGKVVTIKANVAHWEYSKKDKKRVWKSKKSEIAAYKKTPAYATAKKAGLVEEFSLQKDLKSLKLGDVMESEKERAALYGTYINSPGKSAQAFRKAIVDIIVEEGLTTVAQIKAIDPVKLLTKAETTTTLPEHKKRIKAARTSKDLK